ncbi:hypothetical protein CJF30_00011209 [Rutstroemia sp. NJR-2017a BBW]|nr:hypothetical protein CJF30_00011209 [Rutstroemia sp. NJR-2017a BBW]
MPVVYGGIHLSVWNFEFPTALEKLLWKIASIGVAATLPLLFALGLRIKILLDIGSKWRDVGERIYTYMGYVAMIFYFLARAYIVVESFIFFV